MTGARYREVADALRERIALGDVGGSGQLESEAELGARYATSRVTVRKALELLRDGGLVESRRGAGWFVSGSSFHQKLALGSFRHAASAVAESGQRLTRRVVSFGWHLPPSPVAGELGLTADDEALRCRSVRAVEERPLDLVTEWVPGTLAGGLSRDDAADPGLWPSLGRNGHRVASVHQTITAAVAGEDDGRLLEVGAGTPLLVVRRLARTSDGTPVALSDHRYLAHRFSLEVEFHEWSPGSTDGPPGLRETSD
ncbi:MAG: GntR family transcriptional regulator [Nocardioidaceae bacterium]